MTVRTSPTPSLYGSRAGGGKESGGGTLSVTFGDTSPRGRGTGVPVRPTRDEQGLILSETVVLCYSGQQLRDNSPCQAVVNLCSRALLFYAILSFQRSAQSGPARQWLPLWGSWRANASLRGLFLQKPLANSPEMRYNTSRGKAAEKRISASLAQSVRAPDC